MEIKVEKINQELKENEYKITLENDSNDFFNDVIIRINIVNYLNLYIEFPEFETTFTENYNTKTLEQANKIHLQDLQLEFYNK